MAITDDILSLEQKQKEFKKSKGKYIQGNKTPEILPQKNSVSVFTKLNKPDDQTDEIDFAPTAKDYQFAINIWETKDSDGFYIIAKRDLGDGITETLVKSIGEEIVIKEVVE